MSTVRPGTASLAIRGAGALFLLTGVLLTVAHEFPVPPAKRVLASESNPGHPGRVARNVFDTLPATDFVTPAPDGEAYVGLEYSQPQRVLSVRHEHPDVGEAYRVTTLVLEASHDGVEWTPASRPHTDPSGKIVVTATEPQPYRYWRLRLLKSGADPLNVFGTVEFETVGLADGRKVRRILRLCAAVGLSLALLVLFGARLRCDSWRSWLRTVGGAVRSFYRSQRPFWLALAALIAYYNYLYLLRYEVLPGIFPDTNTYVAVSPRHTPGYLLLLRLYESLVPTWDLLPLVQLNLLLLSVALLAFALGRVVGSYGIGALLLLLVVQSELLFVFPSWVLTEAAFASFVSCHVALMLLALGAGDDARGGNAARTLLLVGAGLALMVVVAVKSVGLVFVVPAAMSVLRVRTRRVRALLCILLPVVLWQLGVSSFNLAHWGGFKSSFLGGPALLGHVAWAVEGHPDGSHPELATQIAARIEPELAKRPDRFQSLIEYSEYTAREYNLLLWRIAMPEIRRRFPKGERSYDAAFVEHSEIAGAIARETVLRRPRAYAYHAGAHFYTMWRMLLGDPKVWPRGTGQRELPLAIANSARAAAQAMEEERWRARFSDAAAERAVEAAVYDEGAPRPTAPVALLHALTGPESRLFSFGGAVLLMIAALSGCLAAVVLPRLSPVAAQWSLSSLYVSAYMAGHALFQVYLPRYASVMVPIAWAAGLLAAAVVLQTSARWARGRRSGARPTTS